MGDDTNRDEPLCVHAIGRKGMSIGEIIDDTGLTDVARRLGMTPQRVFNWRRRGVPRDQIVPFCRAVRWLCTPHELAPHLYPGRYDGMPAARRRAA